MQVRQAGLTVDLRIEGSPARLAPGIDLTAYRIVQEALTNTVRHSGAHHAAVTVRYEPGYVTVSVTDTGSGAAPPRQGPAAAAQPPAAAPARRVGVRAGRHRRAGRVLRRQPDRRARASRRVRRNRPAAGARPAPSRSGSSSSTTRNWSGPDSA